MKSLSRVLPIIGGAVAGGAIALAVASGGTTNHSVTTTVLQQARGVSLPTSVSASASRGMSVNQIYRQAGSGVVDITVTSNGGGGGFGFFGGSQPTQGEGAGIIYDNKGDILTDEHVVDGASSVHVTFENGKKVAAKVIGTDPSTDVAVIHVDASPSDLHPIPFADSSNAGVGDPVVAIGSPFSLPETVTDGIISAIGRSITAPNNYTITGAIQTDAPINPGNSGGPLLDGNGHVLGLNDQIQTNSGSSSGVGFAIPSNMVARIANEIISGRSVKHAFVGVFLNANSAGGAQISSVQGGSPASSAGLHQGDLVTAINGKPITSTQQFIETVDTYSPGQTITLAVKRGGSTSSVKLTLGTRPAQQPNNG